MLYDYRCESCGAEWEVRKPLSEIDRTEYCVECGSNHTTRVVRAPGFTTSESLGRRKAPEGFRSMLKQIHNATPGSKINLE